MTATEDRWTVDDADWLCIPLGSRVLRLSPSEVALFRSALDNEYARRNLPDGVELHSDGTLWALGRNIPDGWGRRYCDDGRWMRDGAVCFSGGMYEVRPPQEPPTVRVPLHEVHGRRLAGYSWPVGLIGMDAEGLWWAAASADHARLALTVDPDGTVEVLA